MSFKDKILNNQSPWGSPPGGDGGRGSPSGNGSGSRQDPPSIDDIIKNFVFKTHDTLYSDFYPKNKLRRSAIMSKTFEKIET